MQAKITYYNPFNTDLSAQPSVVITFAKEAGGAGTGTEIVQTTGQSRTAAMSQAAVTDALAGKVDAVVGKGLSTNDYGAEDRRKVTLIRTDGSGENFLAADGQYRPVQGGAGGSGLVVQNSEHAVGVWVDERYGERLDLWERIVDVPISDLGDAEGTTATVTLVEDLQLEPNTYIRVVNATLTGDGKNYNATGSIEVVFQEGKALKAQIKVPAASAGTQLAVQLQYVKYHGDVLTFELKVPEATDLTNATLTFPMLKYFKQAVFLPVYDDSNVTAYCNVWAFMNHRKRYDTAARKYFHKGAPINADDTYTLYAAPFDFDNGTGRRVRYSFACAIWPNMGNDYSPNGFIGETSQSLNNPYICWDELREMLDYGVSVMYHNVDERVWGKTDPAQIVKGYAADRQKTYDKLGVWMKILGQPDGNAAYIDAAKSTPLVQFMRQSSGTPATVYLKDTQSRYHVGTRDGYSNGTIESRLAGIAEQLAADNPRLIGMTRHEASHLDFDYDFYKAVYDAYSANTATDTVWVTSWDNLYEWLYIRDNGAITLDTANIRTEGDCKYIPVRIAVPGKETFNFRDASLLFMTAGTIATCEIVGASANVVKAECAVTPQGEARINLNFDPKSLERAEKYTAIFESTADALDRESALYFAGWLSDELAQLLLERINSVQDTEIETLEISGPTTLANGKNGTFPVTATPANNTHMEQIVLSCSAGLTFVSKSVSGNVLTAVYQATAEGAATITATYGEITATHSVEISAAPADVPLSSITIAGDDTIAGAVQKTYTVTCLPANNTHMDDVVVSATGGIAVKTKIVQNNVINVTVESTANGAATLKATAGDVTAEKAITVSGIESASLRAVLSFGYDYKVATGGVYDADGGYTKIRLLASALTGKVFGTDGTQIGNYEVNVNPGMSGSSFAGPITGDDSALYKDYAIKNYYYPTSSTGNLVKVMITGLPAGNYTIKFFLNVNNESYSSNVTYADYKFITSEGEYKIVMPQDNRNMWHHNFDKTVDTEVVVGSNGVLEFSVTPDTDGGHSTAPFQILDIQKMG